jgi:hypothetical protein
MKSSGVHGHEIIESAKGLSREISPHGQCTTCITIVIRGSSHEGVIGRKVNAWLKHGLVGPNMERVVRALRVYGIDRYQ